MNEIRKRLVEKFIMIEFTQGRLNTESEAAEMIALIQDRLNISAKEAGKLLKSTIGA